MNEKEISEIRRRFRPEKNNISFVRGCCVNEKREIVSEFEQSLLTSSQEETENILTTLKRTLSGTLGKNLMDIEFATQQVVDSEEHHLLMALRDSGLKDEDAVRAFYRKAIQSIDLEGNYLILLTYDVYDVPYRSKDGEKLEDADSDVFSYVLCSICPIKMTKPSLSYYMSENQFHNCGIDYLVAAPELGFLFPAFDDRSTNIYNALYYSRNAAEIHTGFIDEVFRCEPPMPAPQQKETFQSLLEEVLEEECSYDIVEAIHEQVSDMILEHKVNKEEEPLAVSGRAMKGMLASCGVAESRLETFAEKYDDTFGKDAVISPQNMIDHKKFEVKTSDVTVQVNPERLDLVETKVIEGTKYIIIRAEGDVSVNGVNIHID